MSSFSVDVTLENFQQTVIENSEKIPVLIDFWAPWCGPCKQVMPVLESLAEEMAGRFLLAKVNTEEQQELAAHFSIRSIPTFKLVVNGKIVGELQGAQPAAAFKALLEKYMSADESETLRTQAKEQRDAGNFDEALKLLAQASQTNPNNFKIHLDIVGIYLQQGEYDNAEQLLAQLPQDLQNSKQGTSLAKKIQLAKQMANGPSLEQIQAELAQNPNKPELLETLAQIYLAKEDSELALQVLLELFVADRQYKDDYARKTLLELFDMMKDHHPDLVNRYRRKLQNLLF